MVVDDDPKILFLLNRMLKKSGYKSVCFEEPAKALDYLDRTDTSVSMVVSDVAMPKMSGFDLLHEIKKRDKVKDLPFMFFSAFSDEELCTKALDEGAVDYVVKPISQNVLMAKIKSLLVAFDTTKKSAAVVLRGKLEEKALDEVMVYCENAGLNGVLKLTRPFGEYGIINFVKGHPGHMLVFDSGHSCMQTGLEALEEMRTWRQGTYSIKKS